MPHGLVVETFYRVLFFEVGELGGPPAPHHMILNWNAGRFIGYHLDIHPDWGNIWGQTHSTNWRDYPLTYSAGFYAWEARLAFLQAVQIHNGIAGWTPDETRNAKQLVGVPAFRCPLGAVRYAENSPIPPLIATFQGVFVWYLPEEADTGVQALVIHPGIPPVPLDQFRDTHRVAPPPEPELV